MSNLYKGPSIDAFYQVSVQFAEGFQRRRLKCEKLMDDRRMQSDGKSSHCHWQGVLKRNTPIFQEIRGNNSSQDNMSEWCNMLHYLRTFVPIS
jgi:hypothetical protein